MASGIAVRAGTFVANTATGNQAVSLTTGGSWPASTTPKLIIFTATGQTAAGSGATGAGMVGVAASSSAQWVLSQASDPNPAAATNAGQDALTNACIAILTNGTPTVQSVATFVSFAADQFTVNWTTQTSPPAGRLINYLAIGGDDATNVAIGSSTIPTATGNQAVTAPGFTPDLLLTVTPYQPATGTAVHSHFGLGMASRVPTTAQGLASMLEIDTSTTIDTQRLFLTNACVGGGEITLAGVVRGSLQSWDASGFTVNWADVTATAGMLWFWVAVQGGQWVVGADTEATTNTTKTTAPPGLSGTPKGLILVGTNGTADTATTGDTANGDCLMALGFSDGTNEAAVANIQINGSANTANSFAVRRLSTTKALSLVKTPVAASATVCGEADASFAAGQFTLTWSGTDGTARKFLYLAMADNAVVPTGTISVVGTVTTGSQPASGSSFTLAVPAGVADGDLLLAFHGNDAGTAGTLTPPAGWTLVRNDNDGGGVTERLVCYRRIASSEPANYTWTCSGGVAAVGCCIALRGQEATPTLATSGNVDTTANTVATSTAVIPSAANDFLVACYFTTALGAAIAGTLTQHAALTPQVNNVKSSDNLAMIGLGTEQLASAASTGTRNGTNSTNYDNVTILVAVRTGDAGSGTQALTPAGLANAPGSGGATVVPGAVALTPAGLANQPAAGAAIVTGRTTLTPAGLGNGPASGIATVAPGAVALALAGLGNQPASGGATVAATYALAATGRANAPASGTAVVTSLVTVAPAGLANAPLAGAATVTPGAATLQSTGLGNQPVAGGATVAVVGGPQALAPAGLANGVVIGVATVASVATVAPAGLGNAPAHGAATVGATATLAPAGLRNVPATGTGTLAATVAVAPAGLANAPLAGGATVGRGAVALAPGGLANQPITGAAVVATTGGPQSLSPTGLANSVVVGGATVAPGAVTLIPGGLANAPRAGTPSLASVVVVGPAGLGNAPATGGATLATGAATLTPSGLGNAPGLGGAAVSPRYPLTPAGLGGVPGYGAATIAAGAVTLAPPGLANRVGYDAATATRGGIPAATFAASARALDHAATARDTDFDATARPLAFTGRARA